MGRPLRVIRPGRMPYREAWAHQRALAEQRKAGLIDDTLLCVEHDPVVTLGRDGKTHSLKLDPAGYAARGIELVESDRGGDATYHGPGQAVVYVIIDLKPDCKDIRKYVRRLEQAMIDTCADFGLAATRFDGEPGVWLKDPWRKIGAIGARVSRWVTHHGIAFNVQPDFEHFATIVPCGIADKAVTGLARELDRPVALDSVWDRLAGHIAAQFGRDLQPAVGIDVLDRGLDPVPATDWTDRAWGGAEVMETTP